MSEDTARLQSRFSRRLEEQLRLKRFFAKLIAEVSQINSNEITFQSESGSMLVRLLVDGIEHKRISISAEWFPLVVAWLEQRWSPLAEMCPSEQITVGSARYFPVQIRHGGSVFTAVARREPELLILENIHNYTCYTVAESMLGFSKTQQIELRELLANDKGLVAVVVPQNQQLARGVSTFLGLTGGFFGGDLQEKTVRKLAFHLAEKESILVSWKANSIGQALESLSSDLSPSWAGVLKGIVGIAFIPALCDACARPEALPTELERVLSAASPVADARYRNAVGCPRCKNTGYRGWEAAMQVKSIDTDTFKLLAKQPGRQRIEEFLRSVGCSPFEKQGVRLAYEGKVTSSALRVSLDTFSAKIGVSEDAIAVDDNYFTTDVRSETVRQRKDTTPLQSGAVEKLISARDSSFVDATQISISKDNLTLLVVEDDDDQRNILEAVLKNEGYQVTSVMNGLEALGHLNNSKPHLVITDIMMPKLNGRELVASMKKDQKLADIPILVLTVLTDADREYDMLALGVDDYCDKTIQRKILLKRVENLLRRFYTVTE